MKWRARFKNQHTLEQYNDGKERLFREVLDRQDELEHFELAENGKLYSVNLKTGMFSINGVDIFPITEEELGLPLRDAHYRIIYYRRMQASFTPQQIEDSALLCHLLGWQTNIDGKNFKRILHIYDDGKLFLESK